MRQEEDEKRGIVKDGGRVISFLWLRICEFVYKQRGGASAAAAPPPGPEGGLARAKRAYLGGCDAAVAAKSDVNVEVMFGLKFLL